MEQRLTTETPNPAGMDERVGEIPQGLQLGERLRSRRQLMVIVFLTVIFAGASQPITDPDFWWHLKTGQYIVETKSIPHTDIFSNTRFGSEWVTHEWLSEVIMYLLFRWLGYAGLIVAFSILITASFWIAYRRCAQLAGHPYIAGFVLLLGAAATMPTWGVRPQMFSLLLASIFISVLDRYSRHDAKSSIWWLVPLIILWVNLHAGFALGPVLITITIVGLLLDWLILRSNSLTETWGRVRPLCLLLIVCVCSISLNPNGIRIYSYPFETLTSHAMMQYIQEWHSPDFHSSLFLPFALLIFATLSALTLSNKRAFPSQLLMLTATAWAALRSARNIPFFALVAMPLLVEHSWNWITSHNWGRRLAATERSASERTSALKPVLNVLLLAVVIGLVVWGVKQAIEKQSIREAQLFPAAAADFFLAQRPPQPIYNEYIWGGYLIWRLYPDYLVYIDGRADVYGDQLVEECIAIHDGKPAWRSMLDSRGIRTVLVKPDAALASLLRLDRGWQNVFEDKQAVIFVR